MQSYILPYFQTLDHVVCRMQRIRASPGLCIVCSCVNYNPTFPDFQTFYSMLRIAKLSIRVNLNHNALLYHINMCIFRAWYRIHLRNGCICNNHIHDIVACLIDNEAARLAIGRAIIVHNVYAKFCKSKFHGVMFQK